MTGLRTDRSPPQRRVHAQAQHPQTDQAYRGPAHRRRQGCDLLGPRSRPASASASTRPGASSTSSSPGAGRPEAGDARALSAPRRWMHAGARRPKSSTASSGARTRSPRPRPPSPISRRAGSSTPCRGPVQAEHGTRLPAGAAEPHPARPRGKEASGRHPRGRRGAASRAARHALRGQQRDLGPVPDVQAGRDLGDGAARPQSVPACQLLQGEGPRALPDAGGVPAAAERRCGSWRPGAR